ncbi:unnamed protein product [Linum trigynum]|uniref:CCHC-type domain-containing protein n=1 Tax=Linum trigynum TaxID=586398 RepID=A0AAV2FDV8_9ROSI
MASSSTKHTAADLVVRVSGVDNSAAEERKKLSLVAHIFYPNPPNRLVIQKILTRLWGLSVSLLVYDAGHGLYQFLFAAVADRKRVLDNQPWPFKKFLMHVLPWETPSLELFNRMTFMPLWIQLRSHSKAWHDNCTPKFGHELVAPLGDVQEVGLYGTRTDAGFFLKAKVSIDVTKPFWGRVQAVLDDGARFLVYLCYERLPPVCFRCGLFGHGQATCPHRDTLPYNSGARGRWMSANPEGTRLDATTMRPANFYREAAWRAADAIPPLESSLEDLHLTITPKTEILLALPATGPTSAGYSHRIPGGNSPGSAGSTTISSPCANPCIPSPPRLTEKARGKQPMVEVDPPLPPRKLKSFRIGLSEEDLLVDRKRTSLEAELVTTQPPIGKKARRVLEFSDAVQEACDYLTEAFGLLLLDFPGVKYDPVLDIMDQPRQELNEVILGPTILPLGPFPPMLPAPSWDVNETMAIVPATTKLEGLELLEPSSPQSGGSASVAVVDPPKETAAVESLTPEDIDPITAPVVEVTSPDWSPIIK